jgi:hypothetical protein
MKDLEQLVRSINSYPSDIKAEVLMADLIENGLTDSDFLIYFASLFKRGYSKDILKAEKVMLNDYQESLAVYVARDGLYDLLPEGLFHASPDSAVSSGKGMASDSRKDRKVEDETRRFFLPFENEFFYQRIQMELNERSILMKLGDNNLDEFFLDFWKLDRTLPEELIVRLSSMLPFVREIAGDFAMTSSCLGVILGEEVTYSVRYSSEPYPGPGAGAIESGAQLGNTLLGVDLITEGHYLESCSLIRFSIGPLKKTGIDPYLKNGEIARFISCFCSYFLPAEMDYEFIVTVPEELREFILDCGEAGSILGYSTII